MGELRAMIQADKLHFKTSLILQPLRRKPLEVLDRMRSFFVLAVLLAVLQLAPPAAASKNRAAYFLDNNPDGAAIVSLKISAEDGRLSAPLRTSTGGIGLLSLLSTGLPITEDSLFGQNSVVVSKNYLFAVNPGSHTLSMFYIDKKNPWEPKLVGSPADTLGEFPTSVAYSSKLKTACVLNGGAVGGATCFSVKKATGLSVLDQSPRSISEGLHQTSTPPTGIEATVSTILFNPSSTALFVIIKGNKTAVPETLGSIYAWPVVDGQVSRNPVIFTSPDLTLNFGASFLGSDSRLGMSEADFGASIISVSPSLEMKEEVHTVIPSQGASCWIVYSPQLGKAYITDATRTNVTVLDPVSGQFTGAISFDPALIGGFDNAILEERIYVLGGFPSIVVLDLKMGTQVQVFNLSSVGKRADFQGMATYPSSYPDS